jgi:hypothetical protein
MMLIIDPGGQGRCIYSEAIDLAALGAVQIRRASHVEPDAAGQWWADLAPAGGPKLGPFPLRSEALDAEVRWLDAQLAAGLSDIHLYQQQERRAHGDANHPHHRDCPVRHPAVCRLPGHGPGR